MIILDFVWIFFIILDSACFKPTVSYHVMLHAYVLLKKCSKIFLELFISPDWNKAFSSSSSPPGYKGTNFIVMGFFPFNGMIIKFEVE